MGNVNGRTTVQSSDTANKMAALGFAAEVFGEMAAADEKVTLDRLAAEVRWLKRRLDLAEELLDEITDAGTPAP